MVVSDGDGCVGVVPVWQSERDEVEQWKSRERGEQPHVLLQDTVGDLRWRARGMVSVGGNRSDCVSFGNGRLVRPCGGVGGR